MTMLGEPKTLTEDEFFALPDDGVERWLINGELREDETNLTVRNFHHAAVTARLSQKLLNWLDQQPKPHGTIAGGEVGFRFSQPKPTIVGADVAYIDSETAGARTANGVIKGAPVLAIEVLSPSDRVDRINEKIDVYLTSGTKIVWIVDAHLRTITVHRGDRQPELFNCTQAIDAEPWLPGFRVALAELF